jgi:hypothetical protein
MMRRSAEKRRQGVYFASDRALRTPMNESPIGCCARGHTVTEPAIIWMKSLRRIATGLGWSAFMLGPHTATCTRRCAKETMLPYNFLTIFSDGFIAVRLLGLLYLYYRWGWVRVADSRNFRL